jgi:hypothetical protein
VVVLVVAVAVAVAVAVGVEAQAGGRVDLDEGQRPLDHPEEGQQHCGPARFVRLGGAGEHGSLHEGPVGEHPCSER